MTDDASREAAGEDADGPTAPMPNAADRPPAVPPASMPKARSNTPPDAVFTIRQVPPPSAEERRVGRDAMERAIKFGAAPYRDAEGKARYVFFKEANNAPVEAWRRDPEAKRGLRKVQQARKAAGQLIWHPEDQIELAKRLGVIHYREGRSPEGAAERGLYDAVWRYEHIWETFTVPRRLGREIIDTGRIAAVAEEEARKLQVEDPRAAGGFFVRDRKNNGLIYVLANADPEAEEAEEEILGGEGEVVLVGQTSTPPAPPPRKPAVPPQPSQTPASPTQPTQTPTIPPRVNKLLADADALFSLYRQRPAPIEGGLADRPPHEDRGGRTNKGVTQDTLNRLHQNKPAEYSHYPTDPANLSDAQIDTILRNEFFNPLHTWEVAQIPGLLQLAPQLPEQLFDIGVLHGVDDAGLFVQEAIFEVMGIDLRVVKDGKLDYDGIIEPATRNALAQAVVAGKIAEINDLIVDKRKAKMNSLSEKVWNRGWFSRAELFRMLSAGATSSP